MRDAGYVYVNIDDTWEGSRDDQGRIQPNRKFSDMKGLAGYLHARGLKLGLYSSPGPQTCGGYPGSYGYEELDAQTYAAWGVDYLKYDWCSAFRIYQDRDMRAIYQKMGDALLRSGRPIVYSLCQYGKEDVWTWGRLAGGNLWRTTNDIHNSYSRMAEIGFSQSALAAWSGPGGWNDPDMLEIGNGNLTVDESHTHMTLWAMLAAPLIAGNDLRSMSKETSSILLNREVIAIDQDPLGKQAQRVISDGSVEVWQRPLADGSSAVAIFNRSSSSQPAHFKWSSLGYAEAPRLRDLWKHVPLSEDGADFSAELPPHGVILLRAAQR
jgi:alpha-galactosidase